MYENPRIISYDLVIHCCAFLAAVMLKFTVLSAVQQIQMQHFLNEAATMALGSLEVCIVRAKAALFMSCCAQPRLALNCDPEMPQSTVNSCRYLQHFHRYSQTGSWLLWQTHSGISPLWETHPSAVPRKFFISQRSRQRGPLLLCVYRGTTALLSILLAAHTTWV